MNCLSLFTLLIFIISSIPSSAGTIELTTQPLPAESAQSLTDQQNRPHVFSDPDWYTWCPSVIYEGGKYHMFYSRWKKSDGFLGWLRYCEVAHAIADQPQGPWKYVQTAIKGRGPGHWDAITAHNPKIKKFGKYYYLYYISTNGIDDPDTLRKTNSYGNPNWKIIRNNQRTGVAVAKSLNGPWKRLDKPLVEPNAPFANITVNPAITQGPDETFYLVIKGDNPHHARHRLQAIATSKSPTGPFTFRKEPLFSEFDTEDTSLYYHRQLKTFFTIFHAHTYLSALVSNDGKTWELLRDVKLNPNRSIQLNDGGKMQVERHERPFIFFDPVKKQHWLYTAGKRGNHSVVFAQPLSIDLK